MALPANANTGTVVGIIEDGAGNPCSGKVTFTPSVSYVLDPTASPSPVMIMPKSIDATLDGSGAFSQVLLSTEDPDLSPTAWTWTVSFSLIGVTRPSFSFRLGVGETADITTKSPSASSAGSTTGGLVAGLGATALQVMTAAQYAATTPVPGAGIVYLVTA